MTKQYRKKLKTVLRCLSQFQWLVGTVVILVGVYLWVKCGHNRLFFLPSSYMTLPVFITWATGVLLLVIGFLGSWVGTKDSICLQGLFAYLLLVVFCLGSTASAVALHHANNLDSEAYPISEMFQSYTGSSQDPFSRAVDDLQASMECCGVHNYTDWYDTSWFRHTGGHTLPLSCCNTAFTSCNGTVSLPDQFYQMGCYEKFHSVFCSLMKSAVWMFVLVFLELVVLLIPTVLLMKEPVLHYQFLGGYD